MVDQLVKELAYIKVKDHANDQAYNHSIQIESVLAVLYSRSYLE